MSEDTSIRILREIEDLRGKIARLRRGEDGERIVARYRRDTTQTIPVSNPTRIDYNVQVYDTHSAVTTGAGWMFTAPMAGYYDWTAAARWDASTDWAIGDVTYLVLVIGGGLFATFDYKSDVASSGSSISVFIHGSATAYMPSGTTGFVSVFQDASAPSLPLAAEPLYNFVEIKRRNM